MRKVREVLRLHYAAGMSLRAVARSLKVSPATVGKCIRRAEARVWAGRCRTRWMMRGWSVGCFRRRRRGGSRVGAAVE